MKRKTYLINLISGPNGGKSTMAALLFVKLKIKGNVVEYIQEYAKNLVWAKDFDTLNNQYHVTTQQYKQFSQMNGHVDFIVTDGTILHGLYYNRHNKDNTSNIEKTDKLILDCHKKFNNINIFLNRGNFKYEQQGRIQNEKEAKQIDVILKHMLDQEKIPYQEFVSDVKNVGQMIDYILEYVKNKDSDIEIKEEFVKIEDAKIEDTK